MAFKCVVFLITWLQTLGPRETTNIQVLFNSGVRRCGLYEAIFVGYMHLHPKVGAQSTSRH